LRSSPLFSHVDDREADVILEGARVMRYPEGAQIFAKGDPGDSMMAMLRGRVVISNPSSNGRPLVLTIFRDGDVIEGMALLDGKERSADATAAAECDLLVVPRRSLLRLLERRPDVSIELMVGALRQAAAHERARSRILSFLVLKDGSQSLAPPNTRREPPIHTLRAQDFAARAWRIGRRDQGKHQSTPSGLETFGDH
jgi:CRP-like cAMP-binding protein